MKITVIGDGFGARSLKYFVRKLKKNIEVVTFVPKHEVPVLIKYDENLQKIQKLSNASNSWGGLLGISHKDFNFLSNLDIGISLDKNIIKNAYLKVHPYKFFEKFHVVDQDYKYLPNDFLINDQVKAEILNSEKGPVFVCLGALLTPIFLNKGTIQKKKFHFRDNMMIFRDKANENIEKIDYSNNTLQYVPDQVINGNIGHTVSIRRRVSFKEGPGGVRAYYSIISSGIAKHLANIINPGSKHSIRDLKFNFFKTEHQIDVMPNVKKQWYSYEGSQVIVELNLPDSYVSAFHFHESIKLELEKKLNSEDIHICDSSSIRELNGLNPVMSILIQSAKKAVQLIGT